MGLIEFTANFTDHSNDSGFQFEFHCDHCHNGFMTTFQTNKLSMAGGFLRAAGSLFGGVLGSAASATDHVKDSLRGGARDEAFNKAVQEAKPHFKQCTKCGKWVCEAKCWNKKRNLCEACAPDLQEAAASIQARVAVEQLEVKARASDQTEGLDTKQSQSVGECPHCGAKAGGAKFCPECGKPLAVAAAKEKFCAECGAKVKPDAKFCPECGKPVKQNP
jgi:membrane protease subunit (stomatin/prohibitin family)